MSEVMRGQKRPGVDFLIAAHRELQVSLDWLVAGDGPMRPRELDVALFNAKRLGVAVARSAVRDNDPLAQELLAELKASSSADLSVKDDRYFSLLSRLAVSDEVLEVTLNLFNEDSSQGVAQTVLAAEDLFLERKRTDATKDFLSRIKSDRASAFGEVG